MFELAALLGTPEQSIEVQTSKGRSISNAQSPAPDSQTRRAYELLVGRHPGWEERKEPCGIYNCVGHVWASRRTGIYDFEEVKKILSDDGYRRLQAGEQIMQGDVVIYRDDLRSDSFLHIAEVIEMRAISGSRVRDSRRIPWVLSKWSGSTGETIHAIDDVPTGGFEAHITEIWTERP